MSIVYRQQTNGYYKKLNTYNMESTRQEKIARMLQKEFGEIFIHYARKMQGTLISVSEVRITPDLSIARIYLSIFPTDKAAAVLEQVNADTKALRFELGNRLRHHSSADERPDSGGDCGIRF